MDKDKVNKSEITQRISRESLNGMETKTIPVICPWCNRIFKMSKWEVDRNKKTGVTHGICPECFDKTLKEARNPKESSRMSGSKEAKSSKGIKKVASTKQGAAGRFRNFFKFKD
jgi:hypothetical protein